MAGSLGDTASLCVCGLQKGREAEVMGEQAGGFLAFPKGPGSLREPPPG